MDNFKTATLPSQSRTLIEKCRVPELVRSSHRFTRIKINRHAHKSPPLSTTLSHKITVYRTPWEQSLFHKSGAAA
jgi:hypothetical protein